jgi:two-component system OmpR family sensor kinase
VQSIRRRLAISYSLALTISVGVFGAALYWERRASAAREQEEQIAARLAVEATFGVRVLQEQYRTTQNLVARIPTIGAAPDEVLLGLQRDVGNYFEGIRDVFAIADDVGRLLYSSGAVRELPPEAAVRVRQALTRQPIERRSGTITLVPGEEPYRFVIEPVPGVGDGAGQARTWVLLVAARPEGPLYGPPQLLMSMLLVAPLILVASSLLGYWLAGRSLEPVDVMIEELEAVQDGRSLHRRLAVPPGGDEISRLGATLNAMLARVEQSFTSLRRFTADASHELKTPLMVLRAGVERSLTHPQTPPELVDALDETLRQINQMTELVTNLLTLARADEGRAGLVTSAADLRDFVVEAAETAELLGAEQGVTVTFSVPDRPVVALVETGRIRQLALNLVTNAVKYTPAGGTVELVLQALDGEAELLVRDTGIGIAPGDLEHVFDRFWRADPARSRTGERPGVGLGLAICKWIVEAHDGTIGVQSRPGRGTTVRVVLPLSARVGAG